MKRVCAWCGQELDQAERREGLPITHGVCPVCRRKFFASEREKDTDSPPTVKDLGDGSERSGGQAPTD
jgi:hypothetical protein